MKKNKIILSFLLTSFLFSTENVDLSFNKINTEKNIKNIDVFNKKIRCNSTSTLFNSINGLVKDLSKKEQKKIEDVLNELIQYMIIKETYDLITTKQIEHKNIKNIIKKSSEIKIVEFINGKTLNELISNKEQFIKLKKEYEEKYNKLILENKEIEKVLNFYFNADTDSEFKKQISYVLNKINDKNFSKLFLDAIKIISKKEGLKEEEVFQFINTMSVQDVFSYAVKNNKDFKEELKKFLNNKYGFRGKK